MGRVTRQDMIERFTEAEMIALTDHATPRTGAIVDDVLARAIADATAEVNGYVSAKYSLPLSSPSPFLAQLEAAVARWHLANNGHLNTEEIERRYLLAVKSLTNISRGVIRLGTEGNEKSTGGAQWDGPGRVMTRDAMRGF